MIIFFIFQTVSLDKITDIGGTYTEGQVYQFDDAPFPYRAHMIACHLQGE